MKAKLGLQRIKKLLMAQLALCTLIPLVILMAFGRREGVSALLGGLVAFLPYLVFANKIFKYQGARAARQIVKSFYIGEFLKIISSIVLFALVFILYKVAPLAFFSTYIAVVMTHWFAPLLIDNKQNGLERD